MPSRKNPLSRITTVGEVTLEYLERHPGLPSRTLARLLRKKEPKLFRSVEHARNSVRIYRGNHGVHNRANVDDRGHYRENGKAGAVRIPPGINEFKPPLAVSGPLKVLILSDMHVPYHDHVAVEAAIRHGVDAKCNALYLNGDSIDFYRFSRFVKDPRARSPKKECDTLGEILDEFSKHFKRRWYKCGNHEARFNTYLFERAEDLVEFEQFTLPEVLGLVKRKYTYVDDKQWANFGKLPILHGHELAQGISAPVNTARGVFLQLMETAIVGHSHTSSAHLQPFPLSQNVAVAWSTGCLCGLRPAYKVINKWRHGFAVQTLAKDGEFQLENFQIDRGKVFRV